MAILTKQQVIDIIKNAPKGTNPAGIVAALRQKGFELEGYANVSTPTEAMVQPEKKQSILQKIDSGVQNFANKTFSKIVGAGKSMTKSEQAYAGNVGQAVAYTFNIGGTKTNIKKAQQGYIDSATKLLDMANKTTDAEQRKKLIEMANYDIDQANKVVESVLPATKKTVGQMAGDIAGTAVDIGSLGISPGIAKGATTGGKTLLQGAKIGVKQGVKVGAIYGGAKGITTAMSEGKSAGKVVGSGLVGAVEGGLSGGIIGGVAGGISGKATAIREKKFNNALKSIVPTPKELPPKEYKSLVKKGAVKPGTKIKGAEIIPSKKEVRLATEYQDILQTPKNPIKTVSKAMEKIKSIDDSVGQSLQSKNISYDKSELKSYLDKKIADVSDIMVPNQKALEKAKEKLVNTVVNSPADDNLRSLWLARKDFDQLIESKFKAFSGSPTLKKELMRETRNGVQDFVNQKVKDGSYKTAMKTMTDLYDIVDAASNKAVKEKGLSEIRKWMGKHKTFTRVAAGVGVGALTTAVWSKIIKSRR